MTHELSLEPQWTGEQEECDHCLRTGRAQQKMERYDCIVRNAAVRECVLAIAWRCNSAHGTSVVHDHH